MTGFVTAEPIPPGEYLRDELDARGWTQADLASILGISRRQVLNLINGKSGLTPDMASCLAQAFDQDAETWMHLQVSYELSRVAKDDRDIKRRAATYAKVPVKEMARRGWIRESQNTDELCAAVCSFLHISRVDEQPKMSWAARQSGNYLEPSGAQIAWYYRVRQLADCVSASRYVPGNFSAAVSNLRRLMVNTADVRHVPRTLADAGIRFAIVQHLRGSKVDGATLWLGASPMIAMTLRYDRIDNFWFTLMHEMAHVEQGEGHESVDVELMNTDDAELPEYEQRANAAAAEYLIPSDKLNSFIRRVAPLYYRARVIEFANARGVHPGIVVGQLHRRDELKYFQLRGLLDKVKSEIRDHALTDGWGDCPVIGAR